MTHTFPKITLTVDPEWAGKAASIARQYLRVDLPEYGDRPRLRNCIIYAGAGGPKFAVWGTSAHVRVRQEEG